MSPVQGINLLIKAYRINSLCLHLIYLSVSIIPAFPDTNIAGIIDRDR